MKDNFSTRSNEYRMFRPEYPDAVYEFIQMHLKSFKEAWDCGTGNGQVATRLAEIFENVAATDISKNQIRNAIKKRNINYSIQSAEKSSFKDEQFDLITCAQAVHWFHFSDFYAEVKRCLKPSGILAIIGYGLFKSNPETNEVINHFYQKVVGSYWDPERRYLDDHYKTIPFPFYEIPTPEFYQNYTWTIDHLLGYLRTWSAVKHYLKAEGVDPVAHIEADLKRAFGSSGDVKFPILLRLGKIQQD